jgi:hypothetical protein
MNSGMRMGLSRSHLPSQGVIFRSYGEYSSWKQRAKRPKQDHSTFNLVNGFFRTVCVHGLTQCQLPSFPVAYESHISTVLYCRFPIFPRSHSLTLGSRSPAANARPSSCRKPHSGGEAGEGNGKERGCVPNQRALDVTPPHSACVWCLSVLFLTLPIYHDCYCQPSPAQPITTVCRVMLR